MVAENSDDLYGHGTSDFNNHPLSWSENNIAHDSLWNWGESRLSTVDIMVRICTPFVSLEREVEKYSNKKQRSKDLALGE